jgi:hypothetical protein
MEWWNFDDFDEFTSFASWNFITFFCCFCYAPFFFLFFNWFFFDDAGWMWEVDKMDFNYFLGVMLSYVGEFST